MRDPARIPLVLSALERAWRKEPHLRLGQLICDKAGDNEDDAYYIEDVDLMQRLGVELTGEEETYVHSEASKRTTEFADWIDSLHGDSSASS